MKEPKYTSPAPVLPARLIVQHKNPNRHERRKNARLLRRKAQWIQARKDGFTNEEVAAKWHVALSTVRATLDAVKKTEVVTATDIINASTF